MTPVLIFTPRPMSREAAVLGRRAVARIIPVAGKARWFIDLPGAEFPDGYAGSFAAARRKIEHEVREWFIACGLPEDASRLETRVERARA